MPRAIYSTHDAAIMLGGIDEKTLRRWAAAAGLRPLGRTTTGDRQPEDRRVLGWTYGELKHIADFKHRQLGKPPAESDTARVRRLEAELNDLRARVEQLEARAVGILPRVGAAAATSHEAPPIAPRRPVHTVPLASAQKGSLPAGWIVPSTFAHDWGIPPTTLKGMIDRGELPKPTKGRWTVKHRNSNGASPAYEAWNAEQQADALATLRRIGRIPEPPTHNGGADESEVAGDGRAF